MRILTLIHEFPPVGGGGGQGAEDITRLLASRGHELKVLTAQHGSLPAREQRHGFEIIRFRSGRRLPYKADIRALAVYILAWLWHGLSLLRRWRPDLLHVHF